MHHINSWAKAHASSASVHPPTDSLVRAEPPAGISQPAIAENINSKTSSIDQQDGSQLRAPFEKDDGGGSPGPTTIIPENRDAADPGHGEQPGVVTRLQNAVGRFYAHTRMAVCHSYINVLLVFVPVGIAAEAAGLNPVVVFALNAIAIVPLAGLLSHATEGVASRLGDTVGALINVTFGNAVELIIFIIALVKNEIRIVQASLLGSILANLLLILGMAFLLGGLRFQEQIYNSTVTQMSACLLSLSVTSLLLPTAFHASWLDSRNADKYTLKVSRGTSVVLLLVYVLYILFQLKSHSYLYASIPQQIIDEESHPGVLADLMNSSTDSSGASSSDSDDSATSWSTAKRIRKAMKYRRHRKSSASSSKGTSRQSVRKKTLGSVSTLPEPSIASRDDNASFVMDMADDARYEADVDGCAAPHFDGPRSRDFGQNLAGAGVKPAGAALNHDSKSHHRKSKKRSKRRKHANKEDARAAAVSALSAADYYDGGGVGGGGGDDDGESAALPRLLRVASYSSEPAALERVDSLEVPPEALPGGPVQQSSVGGGSAGGGGGGGAAAATSAEAPKRKSPFLPTIPSLLSNTVFSSSQQQQHPAVALQPVALSARYPGIRPAIRRTHSLPSPMNRQPTVGNAVQFARSAARLPHAASAKATSAAGAAAAAGAAGAGARAGGRGAVADAPVEAEHPVMSRTAAVVMLLVSTGLVAVCAEFLVGAIPPMIQNSNVSQAFIGLIILPIVGNAAEHVTAVSVATKNKMDLSIGVSVGSSIQIAIFVTPLIVILGWCMDKDMSLYFTLFETVCLFVTAFVVNFLVLDGRSNYLEGALLIAAYVIIAVAAFYYPSETQASSLAA